MLGPKSIREPPSASPKTKGPLKGFWTAPSTAPHPSGPSSIHSSAVSTHSSSSSSSASMLDDPLRSPAGSAAKKGRIMTAIQTGGKGVNSGWAVPADLTEQSRPRGRVSMDDQRMGPRMAMGKKRTQLATAPSATQSIPEVIPASAPITSNAPLPILPPPVEAPQQFVGAYGNATLSSWAQLSANPPPPVPVNTTSQPPFGTLRGRSNSGSNSAPANNKFRATESQMDHEMESRRRHLMMAYEKDAIYGDVVASWLPPSKPHHHQHQQSQHQPPPASSSPSTFHSMAPSSAFPSDVNTPIAMMPPTSSSLPWDRTAVPIPTFYLHAPIAAEKPAHGEDDVVPLRHGVIGGVAGKMRWEAPPRAPVRLAVVVGARP
ncbi:hypothetical protein HDU67_006085 [Dinochytrium kinnereticum]|nr:hypothetical protein HDU67_006085 [Dinochytrium kinnereticum]